MCQLENLPPVKEVCNQEVLEKKLYTNVFLFNQDKVLLGMKKCGFGKGKWNGFGGKVELDETIEEAAIREMKEEASVDLKNLVKIGVLEFIFSGRTTSLETHIFLATDFSGTISESREMMPKWFDCSLEAIPFSEMWSDDKYWFPYLFKKQAFQGSFYFDGADEATIIGATLELVQEQTSPCTNI